MSRHSIEGDYEQIIYVSTNSVMDYEDPTKQRKNSEGLNVYEIVCVAIPKPLFGVKQATEADFTVLVSAKEDPCKDFKPGTPVVLQKPYLDYGRFNGKYWNRRATGIAKA